jgi:hypothetical protein
MQYPRKIKANNDAKKPVNTPGDQIKADHNDGYFAGVGMLPPIA